MNLSDVAILKIKGSDYHCIISAISKSETINLIQNNKLTKKAEHYKAQKILFTAINVLFFKYIYILRKY